MITTNACNNVLLKSVDSEFLTSIQPIQASHLLELEVQQGTRNLIKEQEKLVSSGCSEVDKLFGGGVERGCVVGISCEGIEGRILTLNLLASNLIPQLKAPISKQPQPTRAIIIDSTGSFPLTLFASILKSRIICHNHPSSTLDGKTDQKVENTSVNSQMQRCLQMVDLSRIFDIEGLCEVLGEIENGNCIPIIDQKSSATAQICDYPEKREISENYITGSEVSSAKNPNSTSPSEVTSNSNREGKEVILIDNMTTLISGFLTSGEKANAHEQLILLSRRLRTLSRERNILTLIHNTTVDSKPYSDEIQPIKSQTKSVSVFPSNPLKPALGQVFAQFPALHIFLSQIPRLKKDAQLLEQEHAYQRYLNDLPLVNYATVIEVLKDESCNSPLVKKGIGWREGTWTAVDIDEKGTGFVSTLPKKT